MNEVMLVKSSLQISSKISISHCRKRQNEEPGSILASNSIVWSQDQQDYIRHDCVFDHKLVHRLFRG